MRLWGTEEEDQTAPGSFEFHAPTAGDNFPGLLWITGPVEPFAAEAPNKEANQIKAFIWKLTEEKEPVREGIAGLAIKGRAGKRRVVDNGGGYINHPISPREEPGESIALIADLERGAAAESFVEEFF